MICAMVALVFTAAAISSCIKNDTPSPIVKGAVLEFEAEGQNKAVIDPSARTVIVDLKETVNLARVKITRLVLPETAECPLKEGMAIDLTAPLKITVKTAAGYEWTISATQTIERRFIIENQVGDAYFEVGSRNVFAFVPKGTDLTKIHVIDLKLGPEGITEITPDLKEIGTVSFRATGQGDENKMREVVVEYHGKTETWSLFVTETDTQLNRVHAFARRVYLTGSGLEGNENGFEYRINKEGAEWIRVPDEDLEHNKGVFKTCLRGLEPETEYAVRAFSGENLSQVEVFTTESTRELPNGGFDQWHKAGKVWNPWPQDGEQWWDTGNEGTTTIGESNSIPTEFGEGCPLNPQGRAAYLETKFVGVSIAGKVAGGNIYFGRFAGTEGLNGKVDLGKPWQHRPSRLKGYYKYFPKKITDVGTPPSGDRDKWIGKSDTLHIMVGLWASPDGQTRPYRVNTDQDNFVEFNERVTGVKAFGEFVSGVEQPEWAEFEIELDYKSTEPLPANAVLLIMGTSSKYSNYFIVGRGSLLYLDELRFEYD